MSMIGKSLVHYEISAQIGRGGMGEVYQAKDTKLGRDVAIKVLPEEFARDTDRVARFQREAKLLASLNHPNIAAIYGLEESDGTHFLVMELIEGDTLRDRIKSGPIPVEEALKLALQIAEALEAAHENGVIHRDLKPANIKVTPDGKVKVLDFGLAKAYAGDQENLSPMDSPTISAAATQQGIILGTAAYMSPEQARGKPVDRRADIWAFGVALYEMLTGKAAFSGDDVTDTLASVVKLDANMEMLPSNLHPRVRELITRCLQKDMRRRYSGIGDARYEIEQALSDPSGVFVQPGAITKPRKRVQLRLPSVAAIVIVAGIVIGVCVWYLRPLEPRRVVRFDYGLPEEQSLNIDFNGAFGHTLAVSPDGSRFVYSTSKGLFLRSIDELEARFILGTDDNPQSPFFSPDGQWIGYWSQADNKLKKIPISGGAPVTLCDVTWVYGANWYEDNTIVYSDVLAGIKRVSSNGGNSETLIEVPSACPQLLSDGKSIIFTDILTAPAYRIMGQFLDSGERKELFPGDSARYLPSGQIVYSLDSNLYAVPFDPDTLEVMGGPVPIIEGVIQEAISDSGTLIYIPGTINPDASGTGVTPQSTLVWVDRKGNEVPLPASSNDYQSLKISPDGTKVAVSMITSGNQDIWIWNLSRETMTRLTFDEADDLIPIWTPDGQRIVFVSTREGAFGGIYSKAADGTGEVELLCSAQDRLLVPSSWSGDGNALVIGELNLSPLSTDIGMLSIEGDRERTSLLQEKHFELEPQVSPDGRWMAYQSDESGQGEIYVRPFPDINKGRWQVSTNGGSSPLWSPDGQELFYRSNDTIMTVAVETEPTFNPGNPEVLFRGTYFSSSVLQIKVTPWDISPDGKRFLMIKQQTTTDEESATGDVSALVFRKINIVLNWDQELKQRVPVD
jgi:serine/threonine protein kinase